MIREQLAIKETANLWCFLGDVTRNMEHYEKAWELSKHKSARAQRCMGYLYFGKEQVSDYKYINEMFHLRPLNNTIQSLRSSTAKNFVLPMPHKELFKQSLIYSGPLIWNNLPEHLRHV